MIRFKLLNDDAKTPLPIGNAAGIDLYTTGPVGMTETTVDYGTGVAVEIPRCHAGLLLIRSSLGTVGGHALANCVGLIDPDYRGEILVRLNRQLHAKAPTKIQKGDRIVQLVVVPCITSDVSIVKDLSPTERGGGSFGSTGVK